MRQALRRAEAGRRESTMAVRERFSQFQINKKVVLRRAGQDLFDTVRDAERETLGKTRRSLLGDAASLAYDLLLNRLLFTEDGQDNYLNAEHYLMLGNCFERVAAASGEVIQIIAKIIDDLESRSLGWTWSAECPGECAWRFWPAVHPTSSRREAKRKRPCCKPGSNCWKKPDAGHVVATYEVAPILPQYSPPIEPQQLKSCADFQAGPETR